MDGRAVSDIGQKRAHAQRAFHSPGEKDGSAQTATVGTVSCAQLAQVRLLHDDPPGVRIRATVPVTNCVRTA